jgi:hypothetical protein
MRKPSRPAKAPIDPWRVYNHATRFIAAEERLRQSDKQEMPIIYAMPAMVLSAFASELLLKCLHGIEGLPIPENIHRLHILFRTLPNKRKNQIEAIWNAGAATREQRLRDTEMTLRRISPKHANFVIPRDLLTSLKECGDAFVQMRYVYENSEGSLFYIDELPRVLVTAIYEVKPEWK